MCSTSTSRLTAIIVIMHSINFKHVKKELKLYILCICNVSKEAVMSTIIYTNVRLGIVVHLGMPCI